MSELSEPGALPESLPLAIRLERLWEQGQQPDVVQFLAAAGDRSLAEIVAVLRVDQRQRWHGGERIRAEVYLQRYPALKGHAEKALELIRGEFLLRRELGELPCLEEYLQRFPLYADQLREPMHLPQPLGHQTNPSPSDPQQTVRDIDQLCDRFEAAWKAGRSPRIEDFIREAGVGKHARLLRELVLLEIAYRVAAGDDLRPEDYQARFPGLDDSWIANAIARERKPPSKIRARADAPIASPLAPTLPAAPPATAPSPAAMPPAPPALQIRCPHCHNPIRLGDDQSDEVLCPGCGSSFRVRDARQTTSVTPMRLGKFALLERVGLGAFGAVWRARDTELDRVVALKIPHAGLAITPEELQRVYDEARKVAQLRHPGIVSIHEVATLQGLPVIVSDFIQGVPLSDLLEVRRLTFREAATLIAEVAEALDSAHRQGVVHRDIKPANLMVEAGLPAPDGAGTANLGKPLILDFGLALREEAAVTLTVDGQIIGTPAYMSPEQAAGKGHQADRRSDVFSLGVVLYELVCGELPFRGSRLMMLMQVRFEEPRPPRRVNDKIPRDLETICLKCLQKDPSRRYPTALALAEDLRHFLRGEPIQARPVGRVERLWRWCRRHPREALLVGSLITLLVLLALGSTLAAFWIQGERVQAVAHWNEAEKQRQEAEKQGKEARKQRGLAEANFRIAHTTVDKFMTEVGEDMLANQPRMEGKRRELLQFALASYKAFLEERGNDPAVRKDAAHAYQRVGDILKALGQYDKAKGAYRNAITLMEQLVKASPAVPRYRQDLAAYHNFLGETLWKNSEPQQAEQAYAQALKLQQALVEEFPNKVAYHIVRARITFNQGILLKGEGKLGSAAATIRRAITLLERPTLAEPLGNDLNYQHYLAKAYLNLGTTIEQDWAKAEESYGKALRLLEDLVEEFPERDDFQSDLAMAYSNLSRLLGKQRVPRTASLGLYLWGLPLRPPTWAASLDSAVSVLVISQKAVLVNRQAWVINKKLHKDFPQFADYQVGLANTYNILGDFLSRDGRWQEAEKAFHRARTHLEQLSARGGRAVPDYRGRLGEVLGNLAFRRLKQHKWQEVQDYATRAIEHLKAALASHPQNLDWLEALYNQYWNQADALSHLKKRAEAAETYYREACSCAHFTSVVVNNAEMNQGKRDEFKRKIVHNVIELLKEADQHGYNLKDFPNNPLFVVFRQFKDFKKLLADLKAKSASG